MRALVTNGVGLTIEEVPEPRPGHDEVLVTVTAVSLNRGEVRRIPASPPGTRLGWDVAGVVACPAASGRGPAAGARVVGLVEQGGWAQRVCVPLDRLAELPDGVSDVAAAALPVAGLTALRALACAGPLAGDHAVITGAGGGVGRFAVQLAAAAGATVTALVGSPTRGADLHQLGAAAVLCYDELPERLIDVALDGVGGSVLSAVLHRLAPGGRAISYGNSSLSEVIWPGSWYATHPGARFQAMMLFDEVTRHPASVDLALLAGMLAEDRLDPQIVAKASWTQAQSLADQLMNRQINGKVVLTVQ
jgi:NADPH:quinone reductase-like Zn-dependent oxidoreductase